MKTKTCMGLARLRYSPVGGPHTTPHLSTHLAPCALQHALQVRLWIMLLIFLFMTALDYLQFPASIF